MKNKKKTTWVFLYIKMANFEAFRWNISLSTNLLFLKSVGIERVQIGALQYQGSENRTFL